MTSGGIHLRDLALGQHSSDETSQRWRPLGNTVSDFIARKSNPRPSASFFVVRLLRSPLDNSCEALISNSIHFCFFQFFVSLIWLFFSSHCRCCCCYCSRHKCEFHACEHLKVENPQSLESRLPGGVDVICDECASSSQKQGSYAEGPSVRNVKTGRKCDANEESNAGSQNASSLPPRSSSPPPPYDEISCPNTTTRDPSVATITR